MEVPTGPHSSMQGRDGNGRRWDDPNKIVMAFAGIIVAAMGWWGSMIWGMAHTSELKNTEQDATIIQMVKQLTEVNGKVDRILERMPK